MKSDRAACLALYNRASTDYYAGSRFIGGVAAMRISFKTLVACASLSFMALSQPATAQEPVHAYFGASTLTIGGGTAVIDLPDVEFTTRFNENTGTFASKLKDSDDIFDEIGFSLNAAFATPIGGNKQAVLSGFYADVSDDGNETCASPSSGNATCNWVNINGSGTNGNIADSGLSTVVNSDRDVKFWGASLESRWLAGPAMMGVTQAPSPKYFSIGADIRGIDQELSLRTTNPGNAVVSTYNEDLDTTYYGAFVSYGGDYKPFLFRGLWDSWGLQSSFQARAGVYYADADYSGRMAGVVTGALNLSESDVAFIGGLSLVTSKQISRRASLSLRSDYEYYSWVPDMAYANNAPGNFTGPNTRTSIDDDDAFSMRTSLRLTIKLGPDSVMENYK